METQHKKPKIAVAIYTYNRTDDARINMEIIRNVWDASGRFDGQTQIIHVYNGEPENWSEKYLEDELIITENPGHFEGAEIMVNAGVQRVEQKYSDVDYAIVLASDTWLLRPEFIAQVLGEMNDGHKYLAANAWWGDSPDPWKMGFGLDFFILDIRWQKQSQLFPLRYREFLDKYLEYIYFKGEFALVESVFLMRYQQAIERSEHVSVGNFARRVAEVRLRRLVEREPVHVTTGFWKKTEKRRMHWSEMGLLTHHDPVAKQRDFRLYNIALGEHGQKFVHATNFDYYNNGFVQSKIKIGDDEITTSQDI